MSTVRIFPKATSDRIAFILLLVGINSVTLFELFVVLPYVTEQHQEAGRSFFIMWYIHFAAAVLLYVNVAANWWKIITTPTSLAGLVLPSMLKPGWRFCYVCMCNAPPRSFHCDLCNHCILRRDHHCAFTGCCVGLNNMRYYMSMLLYIWLAALYANIMNIDFAYHILGEISLKTIFLLMLPFVAWIMRVASPTTGGITFLISLCFVGFMLCTGLLGYHLYNMINGQTTFEKSHSIHTYSLGWRKNLEQVLGRRWYLALVFPTVASPLPTDGTSFPEKGKYESSKSM